MAKGELLQPQRPQELFAPQKASGLRAEFNYGETEETPEYVNYTQGWVDRAFGDRPRNYVDFITVVDFACGSGLISRLVRDKIQHCPARIVGVDPNSTSIEFARANIRNKGGVKMIFTQDNVDFFQEIFPESVDKVFIGNAFHKMRPGEREQALAGAIQVLSPGGKIYINSDSTSEWDARDDRTKRWKERAMKKTGLNLDKPAPEFGFLQTEQVIEQLRGHGFEIEPERDVHREVVESVRWVEFTATKPLAQAA
jgi:ubiquinone/menaquinone biosynthesis C-methylase UbiE